MRCTKASVVSAAAVALLLMGEVRSESCQTPGAVACPADLPSRIVPVHKSEDIDRRLATRGNAAPRPQPYVLQYSDTEFTVGSSLQTVGSFADFEATRKLEEARTRLAAIPMPKPAISQPNGFDAWSSVRVLDTPGAQTVHGAVGADYTFDKHAMFGMTARIDQRDAAATSHSDAEGYVSAFVALRAAGTSIDLRAEHATGTTQAGGAQPSAFPQDTVSAKLWSTIGIDALRVTPTVTVATGFERGATHDGDVGAAMVEIAPVVSLPMIFTSGGRLEPFVTYRSRLEDTEAVASAGQVGVTQSAGAGVKYSGVRGSLSATADLEELGDSSQLKSRLQLTVPFK